MRGCTILEDIETIDGATKLIIWSDHANGICVWNALTDVARWLGYHTDSEYNDACRENREEVLQRLRDAV